MSHPHDPEAFWRDVRRIADEIRGQPAWTKAGIVIDSVNFETCQPVRRGGDR